MNQVKILIEYIFNLYLSLLLFYVQSPDDESEYIPTDLKSQIWLEYFSFVINFLIKMADQKEIKKKTVKKPSSENNDDGDNNGNVHEEEDISIIK